MKFTVVMSKVIQVYRVNSSPAAPRTYIVVQSTTKCRYERKLQNWEHLTKKFIDIMALFNYVYEQ
jgi:hypothetical protein